MNEPEPLFAPWSQGNHPEGKVLVIHEDDQLEKRDSFYEIVKWNIEGVELSEGSEISYRRLLSDYTTQDGGRCGNKHVTAPVAGMTPEQMRIALAREAGFIEQSHQYYIDRREWIKDGERYATPDLPNYPTDANAALEIVEMMQKRGWKSDIAQFSDGYGWDFRRLDTSTWTHGSAREKTIPLAICTSACRALGIIQ